MANETMSKKGWELKERRELCVRVYNSSIMNGGKPEESIKTAIKVIDKIFDEYSENDEYSKNNDSDIKPL